MIELHLKHLHHLSPHHELSGTWAISVYPSVYPSQQVQEAPHLFSLLLSQKPTLWKELPVDSKDVVGEGRSTKQGAEHRPDTHSIEDSALGKGRYNQATYVHYCCHIIDSPKMQRTNKTRGRTGKCCSWNESARLINHLVQITKLVKCWQSKECFKWKISTGYRRGKII